MFGPTTATAINAQIRLGIVRMPFMSMRARKTSHAGERVRAPAIAIGIERMIANAVAMTAIWKVSHNPTIVWPATEKSGGKKLPRKRFVFAR